MVSSLWGQCFQVGGKACVAHPDQVSVKPCFVRPGLAAADQQNGMPFGIEGKRDPPFAPRSLSGIGQREPKFLHVCEIRPLQGVAMRAPKMRSPLAQQDHQRSDFHPRRAAERAGFQGKRGLISHIPFHDMLSHGTCMQSREYALGRISISSSVRGHGVALCLRRNSVPEIPCGNYSVGCGREKPRQ